MSDEHEELLKDRERLNFLESKSDGTDWIARHSASGRGYRLHNTTKSPEEGARPTAREAIDVAMQKEGKR
jgi:hypothetical protein